MTTDVELQDLIAAALMGATDVGDNVFSPRSLPTSPNMFPVWLVQTPVERKENAAGRNGRASFNTVGLFRIVARLKGLAITGDAGALAMDAALGILKRQAEVAVINADLIRSAVMQFVSVESKSDILTEGEFILGNLMVTFGLEYYQPAEDFAPVDADDIDVMTGFVDLVNIFDPTGDYSSGAEALLFPGRVRPAPRTSGPDGRPEAIFFIGVPTIMDFDDPDNSQLLPGM